MAGAASPDDLGTALAPGFSAKTLSAMVVPAADVEPVGAIGARPWPAQPGQFIVLVCTGGDGPGKVGRMAARPAAIICRQSTNAYDRIDVAPYRIAPDTPAFRLRASWSDGYAGGLAGIAHWCCTPWLLAHYGRCWR